jgi:hypothetical protein
MGFARALPILRTSRNRSIDNRVVNPKGLGRCTGSKETAMQTTGFERTALARIFVAGWMVFFSLTIDHAQAQQYPEPPPPQPGPTFNPSTPYIVPQAPETPVSPGLPSALPRSEVVSPPGESPPAAVAHSQQRPVTATATSNVAKTHESRHSPRRHRLNWSQSQTTGTEVGWGVCGAFETANRCNAEWTPRSHRCGCIVR